MTRHELDVLHDQLYVLEAAIEDVERDRAQADGAEDLAESLEWLLEAARPVVAHASALTT